MSRKAVIAALVLLVLAAGGAAFYRFALPGLSSARPTPPVIEVAVASWLLKHSVPPEAAARANPLKPDEANIAAGASSFQQKCSVCHGFDGGGRTTIGEHVYPRTPSLRQALPALTDGQIFTYVNDGICNTAMPAWDLPENEVWQIVAFLRHLPPTAAPGSTDGVTPAHAIEAHYVGSAGLRSCHQEIYNRWRKTRMANVVRDPREHPDAMIPDFSKPDPVLTFTKDDVAFAYGSRWKQRYFTRRGDDYFPLPAQWDITHSRWLPYHVPKNADWWAALSRRQHAASDRAVVRRLPLGQLQHQDEERHRVERGLRGLSRSGQGPCCGPGGKTMINPARSTMSRRTTPAFAATPRAGQGQSDRRQILRLAGRVSHGDAIG